MRRAALLGALLFSFACTDDARFDGTSASPIIGGVPSPPGEYLETGALLTVYDFGGGQMFGSFVCTGTLIAPDVVMMAAHCTIDFFGGGAPFKNYFTFDLDVSQFGMSSLTLPADAIEFEELVPHPLFDINSVPLPGLGNYNDVGLGFLKSEFSGITPGVVADAQDGALLTVTATVEIVGYGQTMANSMTAGIKNQAVTIINEINQHEMQIGDAPPADPQKCHGDSGGPTFIDIADGRNPLRRVIGITSRAYDDSDCDKGGIDMRADAFRSWFDQEMRDRCTSGVRPANACANGGGLPLPGGVTPPPPDAGFVDTGIEPDTGIVPPPVDAGQPAPDAAEPVEDSGTTPDPKDATVATDSGSSDARVGGRGRDDGCDCSAAHASSGSLWWLTVAAVVLLGSRRRSAR